MYESGLIDHQGLETVVKSRQSMGFQLPMVEADAEKHEEVNVYNDYDEAGEIG